MSIIKFVVERGKRGDAKFRIHLESLRIKNPVAVTLNCLAESMIGSANVTLVNGELVAYMEVDEDVDFFTGYPCVVVSNRIEKREGVVVNSKLESISICRAPNVDPDIEQVNYQS